MRKIITPAAINGNFSYFSELWEGLGQEEKKSKLKYKKFYPNIGRQNKEKLVYFAGDHALAAQRGCGASLTGDIQGLSG